MLRRAFHILCFLGMAATVDAQDSVPRIDAEQIEASLSYQQGEVKLPNGVATLSIPIGFRYLGPADARKILEQAWGNPSGASTLGMIFPAGISPLSHQGWGVVITYEEDGHVADEDADSIDYDDLLKQMREQTATANEDRRKRGFDTIELVGWAAKPYYEKDTRKLYWAKELQFGNAPEHTLNYNIRILGRKGVLVLNAVASIAQFDTVKADMSEVLAFTNFNQGNAYADFDPSIDKTAAYGLAALVAGGIAAKTGLLAKFIALLIAFKKVIVIGGVAVAGAVAKWLKRGGTKK